MLVLDKIRGLNQLYAKYFVLKRVSARIYCMLACTETTAALPRDPATHRGTCSNFRNKNHSLSRFSTCTRVWTSIPLQFHSSLFIRYSYPTGKSLYKLHLSWSTGITRGLQMCCGFFGCKMLTSCAYPLPVPNWNAPILSLSCDLITYTHIRATP